MGKMAPYAPRMSVILSHPQIQKPQKCQQLLPFATDSRPVAQVRPAPKSKKTPKVVDRLVKYVTLPSLSSISWLKMRKF